MITEDFFCPIQRCFISLAPYIYIGWSAFSNLESEQPPPPPTLLVFARSFVREPELDEEGKKLENESVRGDVGGNGGGGAGGRR